MRASKRLISLALLALFFALCSVGEAQQQPVKVPRLGILLYSNPQTDANFLAFRDGLRDPGYIEGQNLAFDYRFADGKPQRLPDLAVDLVRLKPDVIFALGGDVVPAIQKATKTIPIVMWISNDPVQAGFVSSLARPGGNITGLTLILDELAGKRLTSQRGGASNLASRNPVESRPCGPRVSRDQTGSRQLRCAPPVT